MGFKKRMIYRQAKIKQEGPHQGQPNEAKMIKGETRWGMYASKFSHVIICILLSHGNGSMIWSSRKESISPMTCSKACTTMQWRSTKRNTHIRSIRLLTKKQVKNKHWLVLEASNE